ncbi:MAG: hypothetical protein DHS20C11_16620 [Lysobacteraceae bacterium]|nr:MAG: hypothetical protein DHS20C11_16620 [Xanthomonadaceae bacterium]
MVAESDNPRSSPGKLVVVASHPVQYLSPLFRELSRHIDLVVVYFYRQTPKGQASAGFSDAFEWDVPLLDGYRNRFVDNRARTPSLRSFLGTDCPEMSSVLSDEAPDSVVVFGWNTRAAVQAIVAARRQRRRVLVRTDSQLGSPRPWWRRIAKEVPYRILMPHLEYLAAGRRSRDYLKHFGVKPNRVHTLPHSVDATRFAAGADEAAHVRRELGVSKDDFVFLYVGKFIAVKRPLQLLHAFLRLIRTVREVKLVMVGSGPLQAQIELRADGHDDVVLPGFINQSRLPAVFAMANVLVLPGNETWGLVANESLAAGTPVMISKDAGSYPELVEQARVGWACDSTTDGMVSAMHEAMKSTVPLDRIRSVVEGFSAPTVAQSLMQILSR